jgi:hypothetical protein
MEARVCECPRCKSKNTRAWTKRVKVGFQTMKKMFPDSDQRDYLLLAHICDDCENHFYTKAEIRMSYVNDVDIVLTESEAKYLGVMN